MSFLKRLLGRTHPPSSPRARATPAPGSAPTGSAPTGAGPTGAGRAEHELALYKYDSCPYCRKVMRVIDKLGVEIEMRDTRNERSWRQDLIDKTGRTQVPCLFIDGVPMFESSDINDWLNANYA